MEFRLLGPLEVTRGGAVVPLGGPRQRALLTALLLRANRLATVPYLTESIWEKPPVAPESNLRTHIAGLRRRLPDAGARLLNLHGGYQLHVPPGECDLTAFDQLISDSSDSAGRAHDATAEIVFLASKTYEWVLEGDITACFDEIAHPALMDRVRARIADKRVLALVKAFLKAAILTEVGLSRETVTGTPQGGILSPLLANVALSVLDEHVGKHPGGPRSTTKQRWTRPPEGAAQLPVDPVRGRLRDLGFRDTGTRGGIAPRGGGGLVHGRSAAVGGQDFDHPH